MRSDDDSDEDDVDDFIVDQDGNPIPKSKRRGDSRGGMTQRMEEAEELFGSMHYILFCYRLYHTLTFDNLGVDYFQQQARRRGVRDEVSSSSSFLFFSF